LPWKVNIVNKKRQYKKVIEKDTNVRTLIINATIQKFWVSFSTGTESLLSSNVEIIVALGLLISCTCAAKSEGSRSKCTACWNCESNGDRF
jgi:hypothetical protein